MWQRLGQRNAKRSSAAGPLSGALSRAGRPFGRQETKHVRRTTYGGPVSLGLGALVLVATVSVVLVLRRRAAHRSSPVEESNEEAAGTVEGSERMRSDGDTTEGHKKYYRRLIRESMERSGLS